jgi:coproporphyrinogen III oxidase
VTAQRDEVVAVMRSAQERLITAFEQVDGGTFELHEWQRPGGGGGRARVLSDGAVFERGGINWSAVHGDRVPASLVAQQPATAGLPFFATGVSLVLHGRNPFVPSFHANYRYFEVGDGQLWWFGGGADLTPSYGFEQDARHFHRTLADLCATRSPDPYPELKRICDEYFFIRHRNEMRGVGGIFFDQLSRPGEGDFHADLEFARRGLDAITPAYLPIVERRRDTPYGERERAWQLQRRGRYVEFNLVYDRGTLFGLQTDGNIEAILMSLPPLAGWQFNRQPEPGSREAQLAAFLEPRDWLAPEAALSSQPGGAR